MVLTSAAVAAIHNPEKTSMSVQQEISLSEVRCEAGGDAAHPGGVRFCDRTPKNGFYGDISGDVLNGYRILDALTSDAPQSMVHKGRRNNVARSNLPPPIIGPRHRGLREQRVDEASTRGIVQWSFGYTSGEGGGGGGGGAAGVGEVLAETSFVVGDAVFVEELGRGGLPIEKVREGGAAAELGLGARDTIIRIFNDTIERGSDMETLERYRAEAWAHPEPLCVLIYMERPHDWWMAHTGGWGNWKEELGDTVAKGGVEVSLTGYLNPWHMNLPLSKRA